MKKLLFLFSFVFSMFLVHGQLNWESIPGAPQYGRDGAIHFTAGGKIYYGLGRIPTNPGGSGSVFSKNLWEYNPSNLKWTKKADFPGTGLFYATAFSINGIGYVGGGRNGSSYANAFYKYNPGTNTWTSIASYPGGSRTGVTSFVIGSKAYVGLGGTSGSSYSYTNRFYSYTPASNSWTSIASFPGGNSAFGSTFVIGTKGYVGCRNTSSATLSNNFWAYTPSSNSWSSIATMPDTARRGSFGFSLDGKGYIGMGTPDWAPVNTFLNTFYKYTPSTNTWASISSNTNARGRTGCCIWNVGDSVVVFGGGYSGTNHTQLTDFWQLSNGTDTCEYHDTTFVNDTTFIRDTTFTNDTTFYTSYDTMKVYVIDTFYSTIVDTVYITKYDTVVVQKIDTTVITLYDTIYKSVAVTDTLIIVIKSSDCGTIIHKLYPNPTSEWVYLYSQKPDCYPGASVELVDELGQVLQTLPYTSLVKFDIKGYASALYLVRLKDTNEFTVFSKKVVIR